jgi:hypothetical protein
MPIRRPRGCLTNLLALVVLVVVVVYTVAAITSPWAFHIGGRWTPLLYWSGRGTLWPWTTAARSRARSAQA